MDNAVCQNRCLVSTQFPPRARWTTGRRLPALALAALAWLAPICAAALEVTGRVVDAGGAPVAGARVELQRVPPIHERSLQVLRGQTGWGAAATVRTSADGAYRLAVPEPGMWQAEVSAAAKVPVRCRLIPLLEDEALPEAVLEADTGLEVRIEDDDGSPLAGAQVWIRLLQEEAPRSRRRAPSRWAAAGRYGRTGEDGRVRLARKKGQKVRVHAFATGFMPAESADLDTASATLRLRSGKAVAVLVRTATGEPVSEAAVTASPLNWVASSTDESGRARLFVASDEPLPLTLRQATGQVESSELSPAEADVSGRKKPAVVREWRLPEPVMLAGRVIDLDTREAVSGALVWSSRDAGSFETTGRDGRYRLVQGSGESWVLEATAPGYARATIEASREPEGLRVPTLTLARADALKGRVVDPEGQAIAGAVIRATGVRLPSMAFSDASGSFHIGGLTIGRSYELAIGATGYAPDYRRVTLEPGRNLEIVLHPGRSLIGRLVTPDEEPVVAARVYLVPINTDPRMRSFSTQTERMPKSESDAEGRFRLDDLPQRNVALVARRDGLADKIVRDVDLSDVDALRDLGDLEMGWGVALHGFVRSREGQPIANARLAISTDSSDRVLFELLSEEARGRTLITDTEGGFAIEGLAENSTVNISVQHEDYVGTWLSEVDPKAEQPIEILLDRGARVAGRVLDDARTPVEGVIVIATTVERTALSAHASAGAFQRSDGVSGSDGSFELERIATGYVEISARSEDGWIAREPLALDLSAGEERLGVLVRVSAGATLTGTVTDADGSPVKGAQVNVNSRSSESFPRARRGFSNSAVGGRTDSDGFYVVKGLDSKASQAVIYVYHSEYAKLESYLEIRPGSNYLDLVLEEGASISGVVLTEAGEPVESAQIELQEGGNSWTRFSDTDGLFKITGLAFGVYEVVARKPGFAEGTPVKVEASRDVGASVTLRLRRGGTIRGRILGLEPHELAEVELHAMGGPEGGFATGLVGDDAEYRILNIGFSEGQVTASSRSRGQVVSEEFTLDVDGGETWLDLDFGTGSILTGLVLLNGEPAAQKRVVVFQGGRGLGGAETNAAGRFRIGGLPDGTHQVRVSSRGSLSHTESVEIAGDTEIRVDISSVRVSGRVVAEESREPIPGAEVSATAGNDRLTPFSGARASATAGGEFELYLPAGRRVLLRGLAPGFAEGSLELDTGSGAEISGLEIAVGRADELDLTVTLWTGLRPDMVMVALVDAAGKRILADALTGRPPGRFRVTTAPPGDWTLLVAAGQSGVVERAVTVPGPPIEVVLPQGAKVSVEISNPGGEITGGTLRLVSPAGGALRLPVFGQLLNEFPIFGSKFEIPFVPPGDWVVELVDPAGGVRRQAVTAVPGETALVSFE